MSETNPVNPPSEESRRDDCRLNGTDVPIGNGGTVSGRIAFPTDAMVGSLGDFARAMAAGTEVPEEFYFATGMTLVGATCGGELKLDAALDVEPRLYTVLLGESADVKKSTAMRRAANFFESLWAAMALLNPPHVLSGVGSAEGLARELTNTPTIVLCFDELRAFIQKTKIESSTLMPMVSTLFEQHDYDNPTRRGSVSVKGARLSLVGCCTTETYASMWTPDAIAIGFPNRLFVVMADRKRKVGWPEPQDAAKLAAIQARLVAQMGRLPLVLKIEPDAKAAWQAWYEQLPSSVHTKRLDSIGFRLMMVLALTTDKASIDLETVGRVIAILDYERTVRALTDPIDADRAIARVEEAVRRQLGVRGPLSERELRRYTNADRHGLWVLKVALTNLVEAHDIHHERGTGKWRLRVGVVKSVVIPRDDTQHKQNTADVAKKGAPTQLGERGEI